jgi:hypothetical protein
VTTERMRLRHGGHLDAPAGRAASVMQRRRRDYTPLPTTALLYERRNRVQQADGNVYCPMPRRGLPAADRDRPHPGLRPAVACNATVRPLATEA